MPTTPRRTEKLYEIYTYAHGAWRIRQAERDRNTAMAIARRLDEGYGYAGIKVTESIQDPVTGAIVEHTVFRDHGTVEQREERLAYHRWARLERARTTRTKTESLAMRLHHRHGSEQREERTRSRVKLLSLLLLSLIVLLTLQVLKTPGLVS